MGYRAKLSIIASLVLFCCALALPAFSYTDGGNHVNVMTGVGALVLGALGAMLAIAALVSRADPEFVAYLSWCANLALLFAWGGLAIGARRAARNASIAALGFALLFLTMHSFSLPDQGAMSNVRPGTGYFFWLASIGTAMLAAFLCAAGEAINGRDPESRYVD